MPDRTYHVTATPDRDGLHMVTLAGLGIYITAGLDGDGQPYVSINTEDMAPEHRYDETTGLLGTARPYTVGEAGQGDSYEVIAPGGAPIAVHLPQPEPVHARLAANQHAKMLNDLWPTVCGMPVLSVHLGDAELYDARDHNPALREEDYAPTPAPTRAARRAEYVRKHEEKTDA
jgi:hypothetical protein